MKITESIFVEHYTSLSLSESFPNTGWRKLSIEGVEYGPVSVMGMGHACVAIDGNIDLTGREIEFI